MFNSTINDLALIELPLVDCSYTWSNRRDEPTLIRMDHCFVKTDWDAIFPNSSLTSCPCFVSETPTMSLSRSRPRHTSHVAPAFTLKTRGSAPLTSSPL
jgi:hypothetical protein